MIAYISLFIAIMCLIILTIFLIRVKKLFSTQNIMKKVENLMNKRIMEINKITYEDTQLVKESSKTIRTLLAKTEDDIKKYQEAAARLRNLLHQADSITESNNYDNTIINVAEKNDYDFEPAYKSEIEYNKFDETISYKHLMKTKTAVLKEKSDFKPATSDFIKINKPKKNDFSTKIKMMAEEGYTLDEIADNLGCSTTEVQYVLDLGL